MENKKYHTYTFFGQSLPVEVMTISGGKVDEIPKDKWDCEIWMERGEDWYAFNNKNLKSKTVRVVTPDMWRRAVCRDKKTPPK